MKKRIWEALVIVICTIGIIACNPQETVKTNLQGPESKESKTEEIRVETGTTAVYEATLEELAQLLEMTDSETATLLGGEERKTGQRIKASIPEEYMRFSFMMEYFLYIPAAMMIKKSMRSLYGL